VSAAPWLLLGLVVVLGTAGQLALKLALQPRADRRSAGQRLLDPLMLVWLFSYAASSVLWLVALRSIPLSQAFPILGLQFALIPLAAWHWLSEKMGPYQWIGIALIVLGVCLVGAS
jgi:undecaprenyl phosphate-alpha-L-ara4N flippase subunit ArnE